MSSTEFSSQTSILRNVLKPTVKSSKLLFHFHYGMGAKSRLTVVAVTRKTLNKFFMHYHIATFTFCDIN